jgi:elongation factor P--(R)-beta-lysine ligase
LSQDSSPHIDWRPVASLDVLRLRARLLRRIRTFFDHAGVLEVDTPVLSTAAVTTPQIASFTTAYQGPGSLHGRRLYLHTSPEFAMKRLLAAGSGSIYQLCKVFRDGESGCTHNPEFTLLEWYRTGYDHLDLMDEVERLLIGVLKGILPLTGVHHWAWRDLFVEFAGLDPFHSGVLELANLLEARHALVPVGMQDASLDDWRDLVMSHVIEPRLGAGLVFVRDYPASQAALARVRPGNPPVASRFEAYLNGVELANGFHELSDAEEQRRRFQAELGLRERAGLPRVPVDERLLSALAGGLPDCAGVALGLERLLMVACGASCLSDVLAFPFERA